MWKDTLGSSASPDAACAQVAQTQSEAEAEAKKVAAQAHEAVAAAKAEADKVPAERVLRAFI